MPYPHTEEELARLFESLGARSASQWVKYVLEDPEPQLARYFFLKQAWERLISEEDTRWIEESVARSKKDPKAPYAGMGAALERLLASGAEPEDLTEIARCLQAQALFDVCYLMDGRAHAQPGLENINWSLFRVNDEGQPYGPPIAGLYESILDTEPSGREMRPKGDA